MSDEINHFFSVLQNRLFYRSFRLFLLDQEILRCTGITIGYEKETPVLENLTFNVRRGEAVLVLGENGSGKTTFLRTLALRHQNPISETSGQISMIKGAKVSLIAQRPNTQLFTHSVKEELATPFSFKKMPREKRKEIVRANLKKYGLEYFATRDPEHLSTGQKQMVNCVTVGQMNQQILLLDEPFAILDKRNTKLIVDLIGNLKKKGVTLIIVEQRPPKEVMELIDKAYILKKGQLIAINHNEIQNKIDRSNKMEEGNPSKKKSMFDMELEIGRTFTITNLTLKGEFHTIILEGPNGVGKTTSLLSLFGSLKPLKGMIGGEITSKKKVFVPQDPITFFRKPTIEEEMKLRGVSEGNVAIPQEWMRRPTFSLSEGQKKWASLEIAFARDERCVRAH